MRFSLIISLSTLAVLVTVSLSQVTTEPVDGAVIAPGESFPFSFTPTPFGADSCVYRPVEVYLSTSPPTREDAMPTATGSGEICILSLTDRSVVYNYGVSVVSPPGTPPNSRFGPLPPTLTMPTLNGVANDTALYLTVLETLSNCESGATVCGIETTTVVYE